ncbi:hypothetical protein Tco_1021379 [Tanacetum coccineum]
MVSQKMSYLKRRLIAADQASVFTAMTFDQRNSSLVLHQMTFEQRSSSLVLHQMTSDHSKQDSYITTRVGITIPPSHSNAEDNRNSEQNPETSIDKVQKPSSENSAQVHPLEVEDSIFIEILKPKAKKTVNVEIQDLNYLRPNSYQPKLPYPERMKVRENDKPSTQHSRFLKMFKQLRLEIGLKDLFVEMPKINKWDEPFSGSTTNHSDALPPSSSPVKTSDNLEEFADELTLLKKGVHEENFQVYSNPLFEIDDNFTSSNENPLFNEMVEDVENENSNVTSSDESVFFNTLLSDKVKCFDRGVDIDEINAFLAMEVSSNFEEGYFDSEGDVIFLESLLSDDTTHNLAPEVISDHEPKQNESIHNTSITFSPRSDPLHHEFAGELLTLPSRIAREHEEYLSLMTVLCEISTSRSQENVHANPSSIIESLPVSLIPVEDSDPVQEEIDIFPGDLIPLDVDNDDSEDESPNLDHQDNPLVPRPPLEPPDVCLNFKPDTAMKNDEDFNKGEIILSLNVEDVNPFTFVIWTFLPFFTYLEDSLVILSLRNEDLVFDPDIFVLHLSYLEPVVFSMEVSYSKYCSP